MVVAKDQIKELLEITMRSMPTSSLRHLLREWKKSQAYVKNKSFRQTIDRMVEDVNA